MVQYSALYSNTAWPYSNCHCAVLLSTIRNAVCTTTCGTVMVPGYCTLLLYFVLNHAVYCYYCACTMHLASPLCPGPIF